MDKEREVDREVLTVSPTPEGQEDEAEEVGWGLPRLKQVPMNGCL